MPAPSETLLAAVARLDMLELTSRIITNPERNAPRASVAEVYALARATEGLWAVAIEASLLVSLLDRCSWTEEQDRIAGQLATLRDQLAFMPNPIPETKQPENTNGSN
ncbi:MAG: hypothetical protein EOQ55_27280 [Mesorhizobium sp.]|uniref:hypothetical protein n=1 Tax=Mesorhizobium sp. TaxID=1871066 RepID=UPI000FE6DC4B|nr:hypothetical protein [Mesorhizobium sp.]RWG12257.1 MAG: hypothetical protein EOQ55_27280 [Mesorhizobium sp.]